MAPVESDLLKNFMILPLGLLFPFPPLSMGMAFRSSTLLLPVEGVVDKAIVGDCPFFGRDLERAVVGGGVGARPMEGSKGVSLAIEADV